MATQKTLELRQERLYTKTGRPTRLLLARKLVELHRNRAVQEVLDKARAIQTGKTD